MVVLRVKKKFALFGVGFLIGILLEVALIERGRLLAFYYDFLQLTERRGPRVACVVFVKRSHNENVAAAERTWVRECDEYAAVRVNRGRGRTDAAEEACERTGVLNVTGSSAWGGMCKVLRMLTPSRSDWFIFAPDNLMVLVDNLKFFVADLDPGEEHYYGHAIGHYEADYNVMSAGVLISRGTLSKLTERFRSEDECEGTGKYWKNEDLFLGKYLKAMGIFPKDTRDEDGRGRFHGYNINVLLSPGKLFNQSDYNRKALYPVPTGVNCCSSNLITIDATNSDKMYHHYYYIRKMRINREPMTTGSAADDGFNWKKFLREEGYSETAIENMSDEEYYKIWANKVPPESLYDLMRKEFAS